MREENVMQKLQPKRLSLTVYTKLPTYISNLKALAKSVFFQRFEIEISQAE